MPIRRTPSGSRASSASGPGAFRQPSAPLGTHSHSSGAKKPRVAPSRASHASRASLSPAAVKSARRRPAGVRGSSSANAVHRRDGDGLSLNLPGGGQATITRRQMVMGATAVAGLALLGSGAYAVSELLPEAPSGVPVLEVPESAVFTSDGLDQIEGDCPLGLATTINLPYGSQVYANGDTYGVALVPGEEARPLNSISLLGLGNGTDNTVVAHAVGQDDGFEIYDVRGCDQGIVWAEANILRDTWRIYTATLIDGALGEPALAQEGDEAWEMPALAAAGSCGWWQRVPRKNGAARTQPSQLCRVMFGTDDTEVVYEAKGRPATAPYGGGSYVVTTPRADTSGVRYQLTCLDANSGEVLDTLILPSSMSPLETSYGPNGFSFAFDGIYSFGGGISNLGTYYPMEAPEGTAQVGAARVEGETQRAATIVPASSAEVNAQRYSSAPWFRFARAPVSAPAWCGGWTMVKSTAAVLAVDLPNKRYYALETKPGSDTYGDFLASTGINQKVVTFSNIDHTDIEGENERTCLVRVWSA